MLMADDFLSVDAELPPPFGFSPVDALEVPSLPPFESVVITGVILVEFKTENAGPNKFCCVVCPVNGITLFNTEKAAPRRFCCIGVPVKGAVLLSTEKAAP